MSSFSQFFNYYTNQIGAADDAAYRREQTRALRRGNNEAEMADTISTLINQGIFDAKGNLTPGGFEKLHDANLGEQYVDFMNTATVANNFRNKFGDVEKGIILGPSGLEGSDKFVFNVRKRDGKLAPMTYRRSQDPDDQPIQFSKEDLKNFYEAQARNLLQKGGLVGQAIGTATEQALTNFVGDENNAPELATEGLGQINEILNKNRTPEEKAAIDSEPVGREADFRIASRQRDKEQQFFKEPSPEGQVDTSGSASARFLNMIKPGVVYSKTELEEIANLIPEEVKGVGYNPRKSFLREFSQTGPGTLQSTLDQIDALESMPNRNQRQEARLQTLIKQRDEGIKKRQEVAINKYADLINREEEGINKTQIAEQEKVNSRLNVIDKQLKNPNISEGRKKELQEERDKISAPAGATQEPVSQIATIPALPDNIQDARKWFTDNQTTLQQLPEEDYTKIQNLLKEQNINSANDLGEAVKQGKISQVDALKSAALIAFAVNGPSGSMTDKLNVYAALTNTFITGDPSTTSADLMNTQSLLQSRALTMQNTLRSTFFEPISVSAKAVMDSLVDEDGNLRTKTTGEFIKNMKQLNNDFLNNFNRVPASDKPAALREYRRVLGEAIALQSRGSKNLMDFFGDIIAPDFQNTQADIFDNIRIRRGAGGKVAEVVFVNSAQPGVETEYSIFPGELINKFGRANYQFLIDNADTLGIEDINSAAKEKNGR